MGILNRIFGTSTAKPETENVAIETEEEKVSELEQMPVEAAVEIDETDRLVLQTLAGTASGMSAEDLGEKLGLESMLCLYRLDKLVKNFLIKRSRPLFMEPELYEVTERGRENMDA
jgi:predicted ArsR family transcriptional regulator